MSMHNVSETKHSDDGVSEQYSNGRLDTLKQFWDLLCVLSTVQPKWLHSYIVF